MKLFHPLLLCPLIAGCRLDSQFLKPVDRWLVEPDAVGLPYETFELATGPHTSVHGWFLPNEDSDGRTVILCHGSGANISFYHPYYSLLHEAGYHVVLFDYRGYGQSRGEVNIAALFDDTETVLEYVIGHEEVDANKLVLFGTSLGSIVAMRSAARHPELAGLIIENAVSPRAALNAALGWPLAALAQTMLMPSRLEPANNVEGVTCPLLFICGAWDPALDQHLAVVDRATGSTASWIQPETGHAPNGLLEHELEFPVAVQRFLAACIEGRNPRVCVRRVSEGRGELALRDWCGERPVAVQLTLIDATGNCEFRSVWLDEDTMEFEWPESVARAHAWPYRFVLDGDATKAWIRKRGPLAKAEDTMRTLRAIADLVRTESTSLQDARLFVEELSTFEEAHGPLASMAQTELIPEFVLVAEALLESKGTEDAERGRRLLERALVAEPVVPAAHYWPASAYRAGFRGRTDVERARARLVALD